MKAEIKARQAPRVEVLLATYNGARYIGELFESLLAQVGEDFCIVVSDDGSTDGTLEILQRYADQHPDLITILPVARTRMGASANFARLIDAARANYLFFCDQDDVWHPDKIAASLALMEEMENQHGRALPILVHTELTVVDDVLNEIGPSFMAYSGIDPLRNNFAALLLGNVVTGCTSLANRALYELARPIPPEALMFDHWIAQVAAGMGRIAYLDRATVRYRQHNANVIGARRHGTLSFLRRVNRTLFSKDVLRVLSRYTQHAEVLVERYRNRLAPSDYRKARVLSRIWTMPRYRRIIEIIASGLFKPTLSTNLGLFVLLLRDGRPERFSR